MARAAAGPLPAPTHVYQLDGSAWGPSGCMGAAGAMALDAYTRGTIRPGMAAIRANQDDRSGGIGVDDVAQAWQRGWGLTLNHGSPSWPAIVDRLRAGPGAIVTVNYRVMGRHRAPGSTFGGAHALYLQRLSRDGSGIVVNDPLRREAVTLPVDAVRYAYTGSAGWGKGTYDGATGTGAGAGSSPTTAAGRTMAEYLGVPPGAIFDAAMLDRFINKVRDDTGPAGAYGAAFLRTVYTAELGKPAGEVTYLHNADGTPAGDGGAVLLGSVGSILGDSLARAGIVAGLVALALLGVFLTFREPLAVAIPSPARRLIR